MHVLYVVASLGDHWGGPVAVVRNLASRIALRGAKVDIVAPAGYRVGRGDAIPGAATHFVDTSLLARVWAGHSANLNDVLRRLVREADVVHIHELWHYPHWAAYRAARLHRVPYIVTPHGELDPYRLRQKRWKKSIYLSVIQRRILQRAAAIQAITVAEVDEIRRQGVTAPVHVIPNGVALEEFGDIPPRDEFERAYPELRSKKIVLFLGRLHRVKGLDLLGRAFAAAARGRDDLALVMAGPDEGYRRELERILANEGALTKVVFTGMLVGREKLAALGAATVVALTSYGEGFSVSILEAMACGKPVIISEECKFPEAGREKAGIVVKRDVREVASALQYLLDRPDVARWMGERGRHLVAQSYSWEAISEQMLGLYERIVKGARMYLEPPPESRHPANQR